jgi:HSP20 family protein
MMEGTRKPEPDKYADTESIESAAYHWRFLMRSPSWRPPTDVYETEDSIFVRVEIAGMHEDDFTIELNGRELIVRGSRQDTAERRAFHQMEIHFGEFTLALELAFHIDSNDVHAVYNNGFLVISLPKARPRQIHISE